MAEKGMKVGVDHRALSFGEESKELVSLVYVHSLFTYFQMRVCHDNMMKSGWFAKFGSSHLMLLVVPGVATHELCPSEPPSQV